MSFFYFNNQVYKEAHPTMKSLRFDKLSGAGMTINGRRTTGIFCICIIIEVVGMIFTHGPIVAEASQPAALNWVGFECSNTYTDCSNMSLDAYVDSPVDWVAKAGCERGSWSYANVRVDAGALPPGLHLIVPGLEFGRPPPGFPAPYPRIKGVPKQAGVWHLQIRFSGVRCNSEDYGDKTQVLHIRIK